MFSKPAQNLHIAAVQFIAAENANGEAHYIRCKMVTCCFWEGIHNFKICKQPLTVVLVGAAVDPACQENVYLQF